MPGKEKTGAMSGAPAHPGRATPQVGRVLAGKGSAAHVNTKKNAIRWIARGACGSYV